MTVTQYNKLINILSKKEIKEKNNTWVLNFPKGLHPKDYKLTGVFLLNKNVLIKGMTWESFDAISFMNSDGKTLDAIGRHKSVNYFLIFKK